MRWILPPEQAITNCVASVLPLAFLPEPSAIRMARWQESFPARLSLTPGPSSKRNRACPKAEMSGECHRNLDPTHHQPGGRTGPSFQSGKWSCRNRYRSPLAPGLPLNRNPELRLQQPPGRLLSPAKVFPSWRRSRCQGRCPGRSASSQPPTGCRPTGTTTTPATFSCGAAEADVVPVIARTGRCPAGSDAGRARSASGHPSHLDS